MSTITTVIDQLINNKIKEGFIPCESKKHQESVRVMTFNAKNRLGSNFKEEIAITKITLKDELGNDIFLVKVYRKPNTGFLVLDENGKLVKFKEEFNPETDPEIQRQIRLMKQDGIDEAEIKETIDELVEEKRKEKEEKFILKTIEKSTKLEEVETRGIDLKPEKILSEKEEMKRMIGGGE